MIYEDEKEFSPPTEIELDKSLESFITMTETERDYDVILSYIVYHNQDKILMDENSQRFILNKMQEMIYDKLKEKMYNDGLIEVYYDGTVNITNKGIHYFNEQLKKIHASMFNSYKEEI